MHVRWQPRNWAEARTMLNSDENGGGNGGGGNEGRTKERASDLLDRYNGDAVKMAEKLADALNDNFTLRRRRDDLQGEVTRLTANQTPEGATILTGDDARAYDAYKALGKPEEVKTRLDERDQLATQVAAAQKGETLREVAELAGYKPAVLKRLGGDLDYVIKEATEDGKAVRRAFVKTEAGEKPVAEYAESEWGEFRESLVATGGGEGQRQQGVTFPKQGAGGGQPKAGAGSTFIANKYGPRT